MKNQRYFKGWAVKSLRLAFDRLMPKLLVVDFTFTKLQGYDNNLLQQAIWSLKQQPEQFKQFLPTRAQYMLEVDQYDEKFYIQPANYPHYTLYDNEGVVLSKEGKELHLTFFHPCQQGLALQEANYGYRYKFAGDSFVFRFRHSVSGKDPSDRLYHMTKDWTCAYGSHIGRKQNQEYTGKFCTRRYTYSELVPTLLKSMDRQFDFKDPQGGRLDWYAEMLQEIKQPTIELKPGKEPKVSTLWLGAFYESPEYPEAVAKWEKEKMDYLLAEDSEEDVTN